MQRRNPDHSPGRTLHHVPEHLFALSPVYTIKCGATGSFQCINSGLTPLQVWSGLAYITCMTLVTITEAKANLSKLIAMVERGEEVIIGRAGKPVATLSPLKTQRKPIKVGLAEGQIWMAPDWKEWPDEEARALGIID